MPIRPENRRRYPQNWKSISYKIMQRAGNRCEVCGIPHRVWGWRDELGRFHRVRPRPLIEAGHGCPPFSVMTDVGVIKIIEVVLTVAHLDHQPENCDEANLMAMCQRCHNVYDALFRSGNRQTQTNNLLLFGDLPVQIKDPSQLFHKLRANQWSLQCQ